MSGQNELQPKSASITPEIETSSQDLQPEMLNHSDADRFLGMLESAGNFTFMTFGEGGKSATTGLTQTWHGQFKDYVADLSAANLYGAGVFVTVNETDLTGRSAENVLRVRAVFVDLDGADLQPAMDWEFSPHMVVESSPGKWHAYWLVSDLVLSKFGVVQKMLAMRFGGDRKVCDLPRLMRVPGFFHHKDVPVLSRLHSVQESLVPYAGDMILNALSLSLDQGFPTPVVASACSASNVSAIHEGAQQDCTASSNSGVPGLPPENHEYRFR